MASKLITKERLIAELFELKLEHDRLTEKIKTRESNTSPELLNYWIGQVNLINKTKGAFAHAIQTKGKTEFEQLFDEVHDLIKHISEINTKIISELTCDNLTQLQIKERCKQLMDSGSTSLMILSDFLSEIISALASDETEYIQELLNEFEDDDSEAEDD